MNRLTTEEITFFKREGYLIPARGLFSGEAGRVTAAGIPETLLDGNIRVLADGYRSALLTSSNVHRVGDEFVGEIALIKGDEVVLEGVEGVGTVVVDRSVGVNDVD